MAGRRTQSAVRVKFCLAKPMKISSNSGRVLRLIQENEAGEMTIEELAREARMSKTAVGRALAELEDAGAVSIEEEPT